MLDPIGSRMQTVMCGQEQLRKCIISKTLINWLII